MAVRVIYGRVDTGNALFLPGQLVLGISEEDERDLVKKGVAEWAVNPDPVEVRGEKGNDLPEGLEEVSRGLYRLPDGQEIKGKAAALKGLEEYNKSLGNPDDGGGPSTSIPGVGE